MVISIQRSLKLPPSLSCLFHLSLHLSHPLSLSLSLSQFNLPCLICMNIRERNCQSIYVQPKPLPPSLPPSLSLHFRLSLALLLVSVLAELKESSRDENTTFNMWIAAFKSLLLQLSPSTKPTRAWLSDLVSAGRKRRIRNDCGESNPAMMLQHYKSC